jgi:hypothetical protein
MTHGFLGDLWLLFINQGGEVESREQVGTVAKAVAIVNFWQVQGQVQGQVTTY